MMVAYWDAVNAYHALFNSEVYRHILPSSSGLIVRVCENIYTPVQRKIRSKLYSSLMECTHTQSSPISVVYWNGITVQPLATMLQEKALPTMIHQAQTLPVLTVQNQIITMQYTYSVMNLQKSPCHVSFLCMVAIQTHIISLHKYLPFTAEDVVINDVTLTSAVVSWTIPSFIVQEQYYVRYGTDPDNLDRVTATITSPEDTTVINSTYSTALEGLDSGTLYYIQVVAVYDDVFARYSEVIPLITKEPGMFNTQSFLPTLAQ